MRRCHEARRHEALLAESARIIIAVSKYAAEAPIDQVNIEAPGAVMNQPRTVAEVKRLVLPIMHLPDDTDLCSGAAYEAMLAARTTLNGVLADVWKNAEGKELEAILKIPGSPETKGANNAVRAGPARSTRRRRRGKRCAPRRSRAKTCAVSAGVSACSTGPFCDSERWIALTACSGACNGCPCHRRT